LRVGSGWAKGQNLKTPKGDITRPTSDKIKSAIFDSISSEVSEAKVLDLFAGSGALGIEALSRGAKSCQFIELSKDAIKCLKENISEVLRRASVQNLTEPRISLVAGDVSKAHYSDKFDIIIADPPYAEVVEWLKTFGRTLNDISNGNCLFILESSSDSDLKLLNSKGYEWHVIRSKSYGTTKVTIWKKKVNDEN